MKLGVAEKERVDFNSISFVWVWQYFLDEQCLSSLESFGVALVQRYLGKLIDTRAG